MTDVLVDLRQTPPPQGSGGTLYADRVSRLVTARGPTNRFASAGGKFHNASVQDQALLSTGLYLIGSSLSVPGHNLQVGTMFRWRWVATKQASGAVRAVVQVRVGTTGTASDAQLMAFLVNGGASGQADAGVWEVTVVVRSIGTSATSDGMMTAWNALAATGGFNTGTGQGNGEPDVQAGTAFDSTASGLIFGIVFGGTADANAVCQAVTAEALNL